MSNLAIYQPTGNAGEYSTWACNLFTGCTNECSYCYLKHGVQAGLLGKNVPEIKKTLGGTPVTAFEFFQKELKLHKGAILADGGGLFFTFTSDPCLPETIDLNMQCVGRAIKDGVPCVLLTKRADWLEYPAFLELINDVGLDAVKKHLTVGFTLTGRDDLEPYASSNQQRIGVMRILAGNGIWVWASIEPLIDVAASLAMIQQTASFCSHYKIGLVSGVKRQYTPQDIRQFVQDVLQIVPQERIYWKTGLLEFIK